MSRYIDADKFYASQVARCWEEPIIGTCTNDNVKLYDEIQKFPTADVESVVRCKDCKHYEHFDTYNKHFCNEYGGYVTENDFCSRAERKDEE
mgnify:FL=1